jgi:hypothetical protein
MHLIVAAHTCAVTDADEREDDTVVAYHHVILDIDEREYLTVVADSRLWTYLGSWGNIVHYIHN